MKSIQLDPSIKSEQRQRVLREVEVLSRLNSKHVVRYHASWIEKGDLSAATSSIGSGPASEFGKTSSSASIPATEVCVCSLCSCTYQDWEVSFEQWGLLDAVLQPLNLCTPCYVRSLPHEFDQSVLRIKQPMWDYLFIAMELCDETLVDAVRSLRNRAGFGRELCEVEREIWSLFAQCVEGLAHLHSRRVIHRDIKPANIFVVNGVVKIGDLGLAKYMQSDRVHTSMVPTPLSELAVHDSIWPASACCAVSSTDIGTFLYAAPEVISGRYDEKSDVYSLGVVLVEMFSDFATGMERAVVLGNLHSEGDVSVEWAATHPIQAHLARKMIAQDPSLRPSCGQVLGELILQKRWPNEQNNEQVQLVVSELYAQVAILQAELHKHDTEVVRLRQLLQERRSGAPSDSMETNGI